MKKKTRNKRTRTQRSLAIEVYDEQAMSGVNSRRAVIHAPKVC